MFIPTLYYAFAFNILRKCIDKRTQLRYNSNAAAYEEVYLTQESRQTKSRERVKKHGEVFTAEREVKAMCDLVMDETERIDSRFLEPACGDGNFLAEILTRKIEAVKRRYGRNALDYEKNSLLAVSSVYGIDILADNVEACRARLFGIWRTKYKAVCKRDCDEETANAIKFILSRNIVCGNALTHNRVDERGNDIDEPIVFSEWAFVTGSSLQRSDYTFNRLLTLDGDETVAPEEYDGEFLRKYVTHYKRVADE